MKKKRNIYRLLLVLPLFFLFSANGKTEAAEVPETEESETYEWEGFSYQKDGQEVTICGYSGEGGSVVLPEAIEGLPVTKVAEKAFLENETIRSLTVGGNIKTIGGNAFARTGLAEVVFADGTEPLTVGNSAFYYCQGLQEIRFGNRNTILESYAFGHADALTKVVLPETVEARSAEYGGGVFNGCAALREVEAGTKTVGNWIFSNCTALKKVVLREGVQKIGKGAFSGCQSLTDVTLPEGITIFEPYAFSGCSTLETLSLPGTLETIEEYAFSNCKWMKSLSLPAKVAVFGRNCLDGCSSLAHLEAAEGNAVFASENNVIYDKEKTRAIVAAQQVKGSLTLPDTLKTIGERAFYYCSSLAHVILPEGLTTIEADAFYGCTSLLEAVVPDSVQGLLESTFKNCEALKYARVGSGVTALDYTFTGCTALEEVKLGEHVLDLGSASFSSCVSLQKINIPEGVKELGWFLFCGCEKLEELEIPKSLEKIGFRSLQDCDTLQSLTFYESLTYVDDIWYAMAYNDNLQYVFFRGPYVELSDNVFEGMNAGFVVFYRPAYPEWTRYTKYPTVAVTDVMLRLKENLLALDTTKIRLSDKERLQSYRSTYESLTNQEQLFYLQKELDLLQKCREKIHALEVGARIDALPDPEELTPEDKTEVRAVNREYQALDSEGKQYLTPAQTLRIDRIAAALEELLAVKRFTFDEPAKKLEGEYRLTLAAGERAEIPVKIYPDYAEDKKLDVESDGQDVIVSARIPEEEARIELTAISPGNAAVAVRHRDRLEVFLYVKVNLAVPQNIKAEQQGENSVKITWDRSADASRYAIYRKTGEGSEKLRAYTSGNLGIYVDTDLTQGETYSYRVAACLKKDGEKFDSEKSQPVQIISEEAYPGGTEEPETEDHGATAENPDTGGSSGIEGKDEIKTDGNGTGNDQKELAAPSGVKAVRYTGNRAKITWKKKKGVSGYEIYRSVKKKGKYKKIKTLKKAAAKKYIDKRLKPGTYYYRIRCYKTVNKGKIRSKYSKRVKVTIK